MHWPFLYDPTENVDGAPYCLFRDCYSLLKFVQEQFRSVLVEFITLIQFARAALHNWRI